MSNDTPLLMECHGESTEHWVRRFDDNYLRDLAAGRCFSIAGNPDMLAMNPAASGAAILLYATNHAGDISHILCYKSNDWEFPKGGRDIRMTASPQHNLDELDLSKLIPKEWGLKDWKKWAKSASEKPIHKYIKRTENTRADLKELTIRVEDLQENLEDTDKKKSRKKLKEKLKDVKKRTAKLEKKIDDDPLESVYERFMHYCFDEMSYDGESDYLDAKKLLRTIAGLRDDIGHSTPEWDELEAEVHLRLSTIGLGEPASMAALSEALEEIKGLDLTAARGPIIRIHSQNVEWRAIGINHTLAFLGLEMPLEELERLGSISKKNKLFDVDDILQSKEFHPALQKVAPNVLSALNQHHQQQETLQTISLSP